MVFKALSSEKVSFLIHFVINKIILDKTIYLCYNVFKIREQKTRQGVINMRTEVLKDLRKLNSQLITKQISEKDWINELRKRQNGFKALISELAKISNDATETMKGGETVITFILEDANINFHADGDCLGNIEKFARNINGYRTITFS